MFTEKSVDCDGIMLNLASGPAAGPRLLFLHGVTRRWQTAVPLLPALASRWQVLALDHRGHGRSARAARYRVVDYVRDVVAFLNITKGEILLYGHSLGALTAAAAAAMAPEKVKAIVLEDPPAPGLLAHFKGTPYHVIFQAMRGLACKELSTADIANKLAAVQLPGPNGPVRMGDQRDMPSLLFTARCLRDLDPQVLTPLVEGGWLDEFDPAANWRKIACPVLLLRADDRCGGMLPRREAEWMADLIPHCTLVDLPGVAHLAHWLATETVTRFVLAFLESIS
jgi:pimeloyl-ACP methyl ester carboxylesterase